MSQEVIVAGLISGVLNGGLYALLALAIVLVFRATDVSNFAQGEMSVLCGFVCFLVIIPLGLPSWLSFALTGVFGGVLGAIVFVVVIETRPSAPHLNKTVRTLALFGLIYSIDLLVWGGNEPYRVPSWFGADTVNILQVLVSYDQLATMAITILIAAALLLIFRHTKAGLAMRTTAIDRDMAELLGINTRRVTLIVWISAGVLAACVGMLVAPITFLETSLMRPFILKAFTAAILGGLTSFSGALVGGLLLGVTESFAATAFSVHFREPFVFAVLLLVLLLKPAGIMGTLHRVRV